MFGHTDRQTDTHTADRSLNRTTKVVGKSAAMLNLISLKFRRLVVRFQIDCRKYGKSYDGAICAGVRRLNFYQNYLETRKALTRGHTDHSTLMSFTRGRQK